METSSPLYANLRALGVSRPYASQISSGKRTPSLTLALRLYKEFGDQIGPLKNKTASEIQTLEQANDLLESKSDDETGVEAATQ